MGFSYRPTAHKARLFIGHEGRHQLLNQVRVAGSRDCGERKPGDCDAGRKLGARPSKFLERDMQAQPLQP